MLEMSKLEELQKEVAQLKERLDKLEKNEQQAWRLNQLAVENRHERKQQEALEDRAWLDEVVRGVFQPLIG